MTYQERMDRVRALWLLLYVVFPVLIVVMAWFGRGWRESA